MLDDFFSIPYIAEPTAFMQMTRVDCALERTGWSTRADMREGHRWLEKN